MRLQERRPQKLQDKSVKLFGYHSFTCFLENDGFRIVDANQL